VTTVVFGVRFERNAVELDRLERLIARKNRIARERRMKRVERVQSVIDVRRRLKNDIRIDICLCEFEDRQRRFLAIETEPLFDQK